MLTAREFAAFPVSEAKSCGFRRMSSDEVAQRVRKVKARIKRNKATAKIRACQKDILTYTQKAVNAESAEKVAAAAQAAKKAACAMVSHSVRGQRADRSD